MGEGGRGGVVVSIITHLHKLEGARERENREGEREKENRTCLNVPLCSPLSLIFSLSFQHHATSAYSTATERKRGKERQREKARERKQERERERERDKARPKENPKMAWRYETKLAVIGGHLKA